MIIKTSTIFLVSLSLVACGGGGGGGGSKIAPNPPPVVNASPGGYWSGVDSGGGDILAVVTETGRFHFLSLDDLSQGSGVMSVSNGNNVNGDFQLVTQLGFTFQDGTTLADCTLSGTVTARQTMTVTVNCTTTLGLQDQATATLSYDATYDVDSSLALIAGNYTDGSAVINVAGDGTIFSQDPLNGCVINGQVSIINSAYNPYDFLFTYSNCQGQEAILNGSTFTGIAALDDSEIPTVLIIVATGDVAGTFVSFIQLLDSYSGGIPVPVIGPPSGPPTGLEANETFLAIMLTWSNPSFNVQYIEIWRNGNDDLSTATLIGTANINRYIDDVGANAAYYYWVRAVGTDDSFSEFNATAGTPGTTGISP